MAGHAARLTGTSAGGYRILESIGRGGMGEVYRAHHERLGKDVAVKTLPDRLVRDDVARARFLRESKIASRIDHPYVATVFDLIEHEDDLLLVMELIEGRTLREHLRHQRLSVEEVRRYGAEISEALVAIHRAGLVHRDLKPGNVMITPDDHVKVMDFGVAQPAARRIDPDAPTSTETMTEVERGGGTPMYMSPEQLRGRAVDARSDLFALGIVLYEAITGEHPFARGSMLESASAIIHEPPGGGTEPETLTSTGPLRHIVNRLLEKEPKRRYQTADIVLEHLKAAASGPMVVSDVGRVATLRSRWPWIAGFAVLALALALVASQWLLPSSPRAADRLFTTSPPAISDRRPVLAVLPFIDATAEREDDLRGRVVADVLTTDLAGANRIRPVAHERVLELATLVTDASLSERLSLLRRQTGASYVVTGRLFRDGSTYHATIDLFGDSGADPVDSFRVSSARVAGLSGAILPALLASVAPASDPPPDASKTVLTTTDEQALLEFYEAASLARELRFTDAIERLEDAVGRDPGFIEAQVRLAETLRAAGYGRRSRDRIARAERALDDAGLPREGPLGRRVAAGRAVVDNNLADRLALQRDLVRQFPDEPALRRAYSTSLIEGGEVDLAVVEAEIAVQLDDADPRNRLALARALDYSYRLDDATEQISLAAVAYEQLGSDAGLANVEKQRGDVAWSAGDLSAASESYASAADRFDRSGHEILAAKMRTFSADALVEIGNLDEALGIYEAARPLIRGVGYRELSVRTSDHIAVLLKRASRDSEAEEWARRAVNEARQIENDQELISPLLNLGIILCDSGRFGDGGGMLEEVVRLARELDLDWYRIEAGTYLADSQFRLGNISDALASYDALVEEATAALETDDEGAARDDDLSTVVSALSGKLTVLTAASGFDDALEVADRVVQRSSELGDEFRLAQALFMRARLHAALQNPDGFEADVSRAEATLDRGRGGGDRVAGSLALARAEEAFFRGAWQEAESELERTRTAAAGARWPDVWVPALALSSRVAARLGDTRQSLDFARVGSDEARAGVIERLVARIALAEALAAAGGPEREREAIVEARAAMDEGRRLDQPLVLARAAAVIWTGAEEVRPPDASEVRDAGAAALRSYLDRVPGAFRAAVGKRFDVREAAIALGLDLPMPAIPGVNP